MTSSKHKVRLLVSYDGTDFGGWQRQNRGKPTVQGILEGALSRVMDEPIKVCGAGRTDAGVHALGQVAHFWTTKAPQNYNLVRAINGLTPPSVVVKDAWLAPNNFHAIASATQKTYKYLIHNHQIPTALRYRYTTWVRYPLDVEQLNAYSRFLMKKQDFKSLQTAGTDVPDTIREVFQARWERVEPHLVQFTITGDGFLKQMVRNIIGTQLYLLQNNQPPERMAEILAARDRQKAKGTAAPEGLYLCQIDYPAELDNKCRKL